MNRFRKVVELLLAAAMFRVSYRQLSAVLLLLAVMMPITVPVPVWANDLNLPEPPIVNNAPRANDRNLGWDIASLIPDFSTVFENEGNKRTASNTSSKPEPNDAERPKVRDVEDTTTSTITNSETSTPDDPDPVESSEMDSEAVPVETTLTARRSVSVVSSMLNQLPENEQESIYSAQNNLGAPPGQTEADSLNRAAALPIKHRPGAANFSFAIPLASLAGRQIDAGVGLTYNSRTWNKSCSVYDEQPPYECTQNRFTYDIEQSWIAPGFSSGLGHLETYARVVYKHPEQSSNFQYHTEIAPVGLTDPSGTRHQLNCVDYYPAFPGTYTISCKTLRSQDGTFISVPARAWIANPGNGQTPNLTGYDTATFTASYPDGTKVTYSGGFGTGTNRRHYPLTIQDRNGNLIRISYKDNTLGRIDKITDTLNRQIKFYYENDQSGNPDKLVAVTIPGMGAGEEIQTVRFYYENLELDPEGSFGNTVDAIVPAASTERVLKWIYLPGTKTAYKYFYHSKYGMMTKIERRVGVNASSALTTSTGTISDEGVWAATTEYDFPLGTTPIDDVPKYTKRTDDWAGRVGSSAQETEYAFEPDTGTGQTSIITVKDNGFDVETATTVDSEGMLKEVSVTKVSTSGAELVSKVSYTWNARNLRRLEITNDAGLVKASEFEYDSYNNQTQMRECGYAAPGTVCSSGNALRITETGYETGSGWIAANLLSLVKSIQTKVGGSTVSKTLVEYDHGGDDSSLTRRTDIDAATHSSLYNPEAAGYSAVSAYRGNVTKVGRMLDLTATTITGTNADKTDYNYDIAGNTVSATLSCCQLKTIEYGDDFAETGYAFPSKETKGSSAPQLEAEYTYNYNTGLMISSKDENGHTTNYEYEPGTLRAKKTAYPNGGYVETFYSDNDPTSGNPVLPGYVRQKTTLEAAKFVESYTHFDGRGLATSSATQTPDGWSISAVTYDNLGRATKAFNPYYSSTPNAAPPAGTKSVEVTGIDALGRTTGVKLQDGTTVATHFSLNTEIPTNFNKTFVTMTDQAGKQRRQVFDSLGRLVRVDEPDSTGALPDLENPAVGQKTDYGYDGNENLVSVIQSDGTNVQERKFKYDSLSRLVAERQVEAKPTLTLEGVHGTPDPVNKWTKVLKYNSDGLLEQGIDARGVTTTFDYDGLNRIEEVAYSDGTPKVKYYYDQARTGFYNKGALTKVETIRETSTPADIFATSAEFDYDNMGRLRKHRQWINGQEYDLEYDYNLAGQLTSQKYPSGKVVTNSYDASGRLSGISDPQRTYLSGMQYLGKGNSLSQMTLGNGTVETFTLNDRLQMEQQELKKGSEVIQKYVYGYGELNPQGVLKNNGKLESIVSHIGTAQQATQKFKYDHIGRLKESAEYRGDNGNLTYKQVFDYDRFGNLYRKAANNPTAGQQNPLPYTPIEETTNPGTGDIDKATNQFRTGTSYDDAGNVLSDDKFRQMDFAYDANGRQIKASRDNVPDAWTVYDANGNRVGTKVNNNWRYMVYDATGKLVAEYGQKAEGLGGVKYVQQDWQGSVRTVTNNNGFAVARTDHQAFGGDVGYGTGQRSIDKGYSSDPATRQGYGLTERDEATGQDHTWFRKNENSAGRWTSPDPYNGSMNLADPQSFNRFSYVTNDPVNFVDPTGLLLAITKCSGVTTTIKDDEGNVIAEWTDYRNCSQTFIGIGGSIGGSVGGTISISGGMGGGISSGPGPRRQPTSDPCAGKKGKIDPNDSAYPRAGLNHVADRHISPQSGQWIGKKSYFEFGLLFTKGSKSFTKDQRKGIVMGMFQDAFENGAPNRLGGGDYAYSYAPHMELVPGVAQIDFVGRDQRRNNDVTNVRTVVLDVKDCNKPKLSTGYPGLARPGDSVNGNPTWVGNTWTLPF